MWNKISKCFFWLKELTLKPVLVVLIATVFNKPIEKCLLSPLWSFFNLENTISLALFVVLLSIIIWYYGWQKYRCMYDNNHISLYLLAWGLYGIYYKQWEYISIWSWVDCWLLLLLAFPIGVITHRCFSKGEEYNNSELSDIPPIVYLEDEPVQNLEEDEFRYGIFAQRIARSIIQSEANSSYSIGITGCWGAGKTSMLNLLKRYIEKDKTCILLDFNPRKSASIKFIQHDFLTAICLALKKYHTGALYIMSDYMKGLRVLAKDTVWSKVFDIIHIYDVEKSRKEVDSMIRSINKKMVVFIDDYDRLTGEEIIEVLKVIGNNGSFQRTFFVSAYDKKYVNKVLNAYFNEAVDRDYTDKYFNLELRLPDRKSFHKNGYLRRRLHNLLTNGIIKDMSYSQLDDAIMPVITFLDSYLPTPRDIKRYIGLVMASYIEVQDSVVLKDFLLLGLVKYKYPEEYDCLYRRLYFKQSPFSNYSDTNFVLKDEKEIVGMKSYAVLKLMFPSYGKNNVTDKDFGYKHLSWKRSFDYYFFDNELGHIPFKKLISLTATDITISTFKNIIENYNTEFVKNELADFVMSRAAVVHNASDLKLYIRLLLMARYFCPLYQLCSQCIRLLTKGNLEEVSKEFGIKTDVYISIIEEFLRKEKEWVLPAILLQDVLKIYLNPNYEPELIISHTILQSIAEDRLSNVISLFEGHQATSEDVYETLKANIVDIYGDGDIGLSNNAILKVRQSMVRKASLYFTDLVWHKPVDNQDKDIIVGLNNHIPFNTLFRNNEAFYKYLNEVDNADKSLKIATSCLRIIYEKWSSNRFAPFVVKTKSSNKIINQCDYNKYILIFKDEQDN